MAIAGNLALLACAKGRLGNSRIAGAASNPAAVSLRRTVPSSAPLLRPPPLGRSAAARCSPAVVRVARRNPPYTGDTADQVDVQRVVRKLERASTRGLARPMGFRSRAHLTLTDAVFPLSTAFAMSVSPLSSTTVVGRPHKLSVLSALPALEREELLQWGWLPMPGCPDRFLSLA
ncbi:hypothetical protein QYE76_006263 [Lolium multiflorum]|uniref:Uncharacterized protein n=1 Tax=Lolium multiflorum TaxID=4521 RepID=A0AAD8RUD3_LOLMU|nr:hypothetical protein QYE76_006263 [Lolium multiflorum]